MHFWNIPFKNILNHSVNRIFPPLPYYLTVLFSPAFLCSCEKLLACVDVYELEANLIKKVSFTPVRQSWVGGGGNHPAKFGGLPKPLNINFIWSILCPSCSRSAELFRFDVAESLPPCPFQVNYRQLPTSEVRAFRVWWHPIQTPHWVHLQGRFSGSGAPSFTPPAESIHPLDAERGTKNWVHDVKFEL